MIQKKMKRKYPHLRDLLKQQMWYQTEAKETEKEGFGGLWGAECKIVANGKFRGDEKVEIIEKEEEEEK